MIYLAVYNDSGIEVLNEIYTIDEAEDLKLHGYTIIAIDLYSSLVFVL